MRHLDDWEVLRPRLEAQDAPRILWPEELPDWEALPPPLRLDKLRNLCCSPLQDFSVIYRWYFRYKWTGILRRLLKDAPAPNVVEIGSGESDIIPRALAKSGDGATYTSVNMNDALSDGLLAKTAHLPLRVELIRDDASNIGSYLPAGSVDLAVFEHSANDILQAILAEANGVDTVEADWFELLPRMIAWMASEYTAGTFEKRLREPFLALLESCFRVLRPGGTLIISHYMFQYDLDLGYHPDLWENMLPIIRPWVKELPGGSELSLDGYDPHWWLFYQKHA